MQAHEMFRHAARRIAHVIGTPIAFGVAMVGVIVWAACGPFFGFSNTWQLVINTTTTIITFLVVFLIQNTQNRDSKEIHLKLDELIHAVKKARNEMLDVEDMPDADLARLEHEFREEAKQRTRERRYGRRDDDHA